MKKITISFAVFSLFLVSCGGNSAEVAKKKPQTDAHAGHEHEESSDIALNHGEKWKVDAKMLTHIRAMETDLVSFSEDSSKDYEALALKLQTNIDLLTSNCTMTGKAHDELHKWLVPYMDLVTELSSATNKTEAASQFQAIQTSFKTFNRYFQ